MPRLISECCAFNVGFVADATAYCYGCATVHSHKHLDLRALRDELLGEVTRRHRINWNQARLDRKKYSGMERGDFCQSILTEMVACCSHGKRLSMDGKPLSLHMCYGADSISDGFDFTTDVCDLLPVVECSDSDRLSQAHQEAAEEFQVGDILCYNFERVRFERKAFRAATC